jgi:hypothetical protein
VTLLLTAIVIGVVVYGFIRADPARNPAPAAYVDGACTALDRLAAAIGALGEGVEEGVADDTATELANGAEADAIAADDALGMLPEWPPGEPLDELLAGMLLDSLNAIAAIREGEMATARDDQESAANALAAAEASLANGRYGFACD